MSHKIEINDDLYALLVRLAAFKNCSVRDILHEGILDALTQEYEKIFFPLKKVPSAYGEKLKAYVDRYVQKQVDNL